MGDEDTTRIIRKPEGAEEQTTKTDLIGGSVGSGDKTENGENGNSSDPETKIVRPKSSPKNPASDSPDIHMDLSDNPVVGWLVVVEGKGAGSSHVLGYGANSIGRSEGERVTLNYGDDEISREQHAKITFDHKNAKFYLQPGEGANLTYIGDAPVLQPVELFGRENINIGNTTLCFVPFCGELFSW